MSPSARRWAVNLARVAVTAAAVVVVIRMIRWQDYWVVQEGLFDKPKYHDLDRIRSVGNFSGGKAVTWADGHIVVCVDAAKREGFLSLFDHTNKPLFLAMLVALLVPYVFLALRWWLLLRSHGFTPPLGQIFFTSGWYLLLGKPA